MDKLAKKSVDLKTDTPSTTNGRSDGGLRRFRCSYQSCPVMGEQGFYTFPQMEPRRSAWMRACGMSPDDWTAASSRVCRKHFLNTDFDDASGTRLKNTAIPSVLKSGDSPSIVASGNVRKKIKPTILKKSNKGSSTHVELVLQQDLEQQKKLQKVQELELQQAKERLSEKRKLEMITSHFRTSKKLGLNDKVEDNRRRTFSCHQCTFATDSQLLMGEHAVFLHQTSDCKFATDSQLLIGEHANFLNQMSEEDLKCHSISPQNTGKRVGVSSTTVSHPKEEKLLQKRPHVSMTPVGQLEHYSTRSDVSTAMNSLPTIQLQNAEKPGIVLPYIKPEGVSSTIVSLPTEEIPINVRFHVNMTPVGQLVHYGTQSNVSTSMDSLPTKHVQNAEKPSIVLPYIKPEAVSSTIVSPPKEEKPINMPPHVNMTSVGKLVHYGTKSDVSNEIDSIPTIQRQNAEKPAIVLPYIKAEDVSPTIAPPPKEEKPINVRSHVNMTPLSQLVHYGTQSDVSNTMDSISTTQNVEKPEIVLPCIKTEDVSSTIAPPPKEENPINMSPYCNMTPVGKLVHYATQSDVSNAMDSIPSIQVQNAEKPAIVLPCIKPEIMEEDPCYNDSLKEEPRSDKTEDPCQQADVLLPTVLNQRLQRDECSQMGDEGTLANRLTANVLQQSAASIRPSFTLVNLKPKL